MNTILVTTNGPLECKGEIELYAADGSSLAHETHTWLCRCGHSQEKPYCDGSHERTGFRDESVPPSTADTSAADLTGPVRITLREKGPLKLVGPLCVLHPSAGLIFAGAETALCRCGASRKKPFCDGTHRQLPSAS
jgi:CDGSH-type Zn-finger protein